MSYPIFSIITVTYNAVKTVDNTIISVLEQDSSLFEYIIIDGGSTDGTVNCIKKHLDNITFWTSEPDNGIYDAMNKGVKASRGKWIFFLGADDRLMPGILKYVNAHLDDSLDLLFGNIMFSNGKRYNSILSLKTLLNNTLHHQSSFYNRNLFDSFLYDTSIKVMADYELNLLIYLHKKKTKKIDIDIAECDTHGVSFDINRSLTEIRYVHSKYFNPFFSFFISSITKLKYFIHYRLLLEH